MKHKAPQEPKPYKAFRDKYLAAVMMVAALFITLAASAQTDSLKYSQINGYGFKYKRMAFDSVLMVPLSTSPHVPYRKGGLRYNPIDSTLQLWTGYQWKSIVTGGNGIDTAYVVGDSLIVIETPNEDFYINVRGQNISNSSLTANGDYVQDWMHHWFFLNDLKAVDLNSYRADDNHPGNKKRFRFYSDSTIDANPLQLMWGLKNVDEDFTDSLRFELTSTKDLTYLYQHVDEGGKMIEMDWDPHGFYPSTKIYANGNSKNGYYELGASVATIQPNDSVVITGVPSTIDTTNIKPVGIGPFGKIYKLPGWPGSGSGSRFGVEDNLATGNRQFDFSGNSFEGDSFSYYNLYSKVAASGVDRGLRSRLTMNDQNIDLFTYHSNGVSTRSYGFTAGPSLTQMVAQGHVSGHAGFVQADTNQVILESDPNRLYVYHDSVTITNFNNLPLHLRFRPLPSTVDTTNWKPAAIGPEGQMKIMAGWPGGGGGGGGDITANVFKDSSFVPLIAIFGESNASGVAHNSCATGADTAAHPLVQIMQQSGAFADLNIGINNNLTENTGNHGMELELQNQIATYFNNRTVYLVKAGKGGSTISQWAAGSANADTLFTRMNNAMARLYAMGKIPVLCVWYSQGINDGVAGTDGNTWKTATLDLFQRFRQRYGVCPILMTQLVGDRTANPNLNTIDAKIFELALDKGNFIFRIPTPQTSGGTGCTDSLQSPVHWDYLGMKAVTQRMLRAMMDTAGFINYDRRARYANLNAWQLGGNYYTDPAVHSIGTLDTAQLIFKQGGVERARFYSNGYFGLGKLPSHPFDVNGNAMINGMLVSSGSSNIASTHNIILAPSVSTTGTNNFIADPSGDQNSTSFGNILIGDGASAGGGGKNVRVRIGFQAGYQRNGHRAIYIGSQVGTWSGYSGIEDDVFAVGSQATGAFLYGDMSTGQLQINAASTPALTASAALEVKSTTRGFLTPIMTATQRLAISSPATGLEVFDTDSARKMMYNGSAWKAVAWTTDVSGSGDGNGIYGGNGSLPSDVTVTGSNNSLLFNDIFAFRINSDYNTIAKANGTGIYTEAVIGAGNIYELGFTPTAGIYSKGAGLFIDTNENVGLGTQPPTTMPLYATGASTYLQGLQSNLGNFYRVSNFTADFTAGLNYYFISIDATSGNVTMTLPAASTAFGNTMGIVYKIQRIDNSGNTVTVQRAGSDTINGATSFTITSQYQVKQMQCTSSSTWAQW